LRHQQKWVFQSEIDFFRKNFLDLYIMKNRSIIIAFILFVCLVSLRPGNVAANPKISKLAAISRNTEKPLEIIITHVHEGKRVRISSIHNSAAGNRLTFIFADGSRITLNFMKMVTTGNHQIIDRKSELQAIYYPVGGYPVTMFGFVTIYGLKPITGRLVELYDAEHELHISSSNIFAF